MRSPDLRLLSLTEEHAQPPLISEADASRPNDSVPSPSLDRRTRKLNVSTLSYNLYGYGAEDERPNLYCGDGRMRQFKVCTLSYNPYKHSSTKIN
jgi:hypothetical protein